MLMVGTFFIHVPQSTPGLPKPAELLRRLLPYELNIALRRLLVADQLGRHIATFGCLELESECCGVQGIRCFPFPFDKFHDTNPQPYVAVIPTTRYSAIAF